MVEDDILFTNPLAGKGLTLGSMDNSFFYHLFYFTQESYLSKDLGEIYIWKNL